jgi:hypothetical protein
VGLQDGLGETFETTMDCTPIVLQLAMAFNRYSQAPGAMVEDQAFKFEHTSSSAC